MSSAFKTLKTSDVTVTPYVTNKSYTIPYNVSTYSTYGINYTYAAANTGSLLNPSTNQLYYRSVRQLYYSNYLSSLAPTIPLSEQDYNQLEEDQYGRRKTKNTLIYDNYLQSTAASGSSEVDLRINFPTGSGDQVGVLSIPQNLYGEYIQPGTFALIENTNTLLIDDSNGNIVVASAPTVYVGNIIYSHGIIVITDSDYIATFDIGTGQSIKFKATFTIYENQTRCHVNENEFNFTQNPSAASGSTGYYNSNVTGSSFAPYVTTVGLYNAANQLLAVGKLGQPYPVPANTDITFVVKYDS
jgi:hypothetical protein